jgi:hypothetical protein
VIQKEFMPERKTGNSEICVHVPEGLFKCILKVRLAVLRKKAVYSYYITVPLIILL